jgi:hypothetical protein
LLNEPGAQENLHPCLNPGARRNCRRRITLETHYLVVAPTVSRDWRSTHFGTKIEKAQKYIVQGAPISFVPEHVFEEALG